MSEGKKRKRGNVSDADNTWKPTVEEQEVAKYMHKKLPSKECRLGGMVVNVFMAEEAIDLLMDSPWAKVLPTSSSAKGIRRLFSSRETVLVFLKAMLTKGLFRRAVYVKKKLPSKSPEDNGSAGKAKTKLKRDSEIAPSNKSIAAGGSKTPTKQPIQDSTPLSNQADVAVANTDSANENQRTSCSPVDSSGSVSSPTASGTTSRSNKSNSSASSSSSSTKSSSKKPPRIELATEQYFVDDDPTTVYVWIYEPPPGLFNWLAGSAVLIGIILCCLFPIWPPTLRLGAYYLTICASGLFGLLICVAVVRLFLFMTAWLLTLGHLRFWLFPNFFEDCGFFESFRPLYAIAHGAEMTADNSTSKRTKNGKSTISKSDPSSVKINANRSVSGSSGVSSDREKKLV